MAHDPSYIEAGGTKDMEQLHCFGGMIGMMTKSAIPDLDGVLPDAGCFPKSRTGGSAA